MAFQSVPETAEIAVIYTMDSITMQNTYHARIAGGYDTSDLDALADAVDLSVDDGFLPRWPNDVSYIKTEVRGLELLNDQVVENNDSTAVGEQAVDPLPNNVAFVIKKLSGLTGRSARGRVYLAGIPQTDLVSGGSNELDPTAAANWQGAVEALRQDIDNVSGWAPVIVSRYKDGSQRTEGVTFPWIATSRTDNQVDTRRDRLA